MPRKVDAIVLPTWENVARDKIMLRYGYLREEHNH